MLARVYGPKYNTFPCYVQPKLNGIRALCQAGIFQSRDEKIWNLNVLQHLDNELDTIQNLLGATILDGELYVHGWRLQRINSAVAVNRLSPTEDTPHVSFHVFDVVNPALDFWTRSVDILRTIHNADLPHIRAVQTDHAHSRDEVDRYFHHYTSLGYEGIMLRPDGPYEFGEHEGRNGRTQHRSKTLWKHKQWEDGEFVCVGFTQGEGKADIGIGALICEISKNREVFQPLASIQFNVGTGFTDAERANFFLAPPLGKLIKVRYLCLSADGIPLNPSFLYVL